MNTQKQLDRAFILGFTETRKECFGAMSANEVLKKHPGLFPDEIDCYLAGNEDAIANDTFRMFFVTERLKANYSANL